MGALNGISLCKTRRMLKICIGCVCSKCKSAPVRSDLLALGKFFNSVLFAFTVVVVVMAKPKENELTCRKC